MSEDVHVCHFVFMPVAAEMHDWASLFKRQGSRGLPCNDKRLITRVTRGSAPGDSQHVRARVVHPHPPGKQSAQTLIVPGCAGAAAAVTRTRCSETAQVSCT
jgi:hypothetical protein